MQRVLYQRVLVPFTHAASLQRPWLLFVDMLDRMLKADTEGFRHAILEMPKAADTLISCLELCEGGVQQLQSHLLEGLYAALRKMDRGASL